jgi:3-phosphoshikimate 1-carboxyvinyltransferase
MSSDDVTIYPATRLQGRLCVPGDKSISHRYALLAALATGNTTIESYSEGLDCASTLQCLAALGVSIDIVRERRGSAGLDIRIQGRGLGGFTQPSAPLDAGNSGSTMRMLTGVLAAHSFQSLLDGDKSLRQRPMNRVIVPLERMGASIKATDGRPPLTVNGTNELKPIIFKTDTPSAQVKSTVLLAGLHADGVTSVHESIQTRNHTELALEAFGVKVEHKDNQVLLAGRQNLKALNLTVPGDISSAAFLMAAAAALPKSDLTIFNVGLNPTRTAILQVLERMGALVETEILESLGGEPSGTIRIRYGVLRKVEIMPSEVPGLIDELPALAALATQGGELLVRGAQELRVKESDRISLLTKGLRCLGAEIEEFQDGFHVQGNKKLTGGRTNAYGDHRLAMAFAVAALGAVGPSTIEDATAVSVSYPGFFDMLEGLSQ